MQTRQKKRNNPLLGLLHYIGASAGVALLSAIIYLCRLDLSPASVPLLYLLVVILSALISGRGAAVWASVCSFLAFNWFFVKPLYTFTVQKPGEWIALCMFLLIAIVTGQLMAMLKSRAQQARQHQLEATALSEASWAIASKLDTTSALSEVIKQIAQVVDLETAAVILEKEGQRTISSSYPSERITDLSQIEKEQDGSDDARVTFPIEMNEKNFGVLVLRLRDPQLTDEQRSILKSLVNYAAVILQRDELMSIQTKAAALADADRLKTALLNMVSHDFRSPLTTIKASISTLLSKGPPLKDEAKIGLYQAIEQETDRLNRIVGNILDLSRLEAGAWKPKIERVPITELIGMALEPFTASENQRITLSLDPSITELEIDSVQMVQVLKNLVENAVKYSPPDSSIVIETIRKDGFIQIRILDRGRGLSEQELPQIFDPFFRGSLFQESAVPGVGIGLAVCRGLVEAHGGMLMASNRADGGAVFTVALPLKN